MGLFFKQLIVPRTYVAATNPIYYGDGLGGSEFFTPSNEFFGRQTIPSDNKWKDESGAGLWILQGKEIQLKAGDDITIPRCLSHRFESAKGIKEPLKILYRYDSQRWDMEERFFRNVLTYFDDCRKHGVEPSILQVCVFLSDCWMPGDIIQCPGGDYVRCFVNAMFMWVAAFIGRYLYGYKGNYVEYYDVEISRKRMDAEEKKLK